MTDETKAKTDSPAQEIAQITKAHFQAVLENIGMIAIMLDTEGRVIFCNEFLLALTGWQMDEVVRQDWFKMFLPPRNSDIHKATFFSKLSAPANFPYGLKTKSSPARGNGG